MTRAVLALGSNLGDRHGQLRQAVAGLGDTVLAVSGVYESDPWPPGEETPPYLNAVVLAADDGTDPYAWLARARELEQRAGRVRDPAHRYAPRTLDVDVVAVCDDAGAHVCTDDPELTLPHPWAHARAFVLRPWRDIQPRAWLPGHGPLTDLLRTPELAADAAALRPCPELPLESEE